MPAKERSMADEVMIEAVIIASMTMATKRGMDATAAQLE
jgi:hypothetical protein